MAVGNLTHTCTCTVDFLLCENFSIINTFNLHVSVNGVWSCVKPLELGTWGGHGKRTFIESIFHSSILKYCLQSRQMAKLYGDEPFAPWPWQSQQKINNAMKCYGHRQVSPLVKDQSAAGKALSWLCSGRGTMTTIIWIYLFYAVFNRLN